MSSLPLFTSSLRALDASTKASTAFRLFDELAGPKIDVLIGATSFAIGNINPGGLTMRA